MGIESMRVEAFPQQLTHTHRSGQDPRAWLARPREFGRVDTRRRRGNTPERRGEGRAREVAERARQGQIISTSDRKEGRSGQRVVTAGQCKDSIKDLLKYLD
jgi:hypothetical protein